MRKIINTEKSKDFKCYATPERVEGRRILKITYGAGSYGMGGYGFLGLLLDNCSLAVSSALCLHVQAASGSASSVFAFSTATEEPTEMPHAAHCSLESRFC